MVGACNPLNSMLGVSPDYSILYRRDIHNKKLNIYSYTTWECLEGNPESDLPKGNNFIACKTPKIILNELQSFIRKAQLIQSLGVELLLSIKFFRAQVKMMSAELLLSIKFLITRCLSISSSITNTSKYEWWRHLASSCIKVIKIRELRGCDMAASVRFSCIPTGSQ